MDGFTRSKSAREGEKREEAFRNKECVYVLGGGGGGLRPLFPFCFFWSPRAPPPRTYTREIFTITMIHTIAAARNA
jgi:hypothetical protein